MNTLYNINVTNDDTFQVTITNDNEFTVTFVDGPGVRIAVGTTAPSNPTVNDIWIDTN